VSHSALLLLRIFDGTPVPDARRLDSLQSAIPGLWVKTVPSTAGLDDLLLCATESTCETLLFADFLPTASTLHALLRSVQRAGPGAALTLPTAALDSFGFSVPLSGGAAAMAQQARPLLTLPPWLAAVPRAAALEHRAQASHWETLEYFLLDFAVAWRGAGRAVVALGTALEEFDGRVWAGDRFIGDYGALARDFQRAPSCLSTEQIPPQYRVSMVGEEATARGNGAVSPGATSPTFSLLCPAYKSDFFAETVSSVLAQTYTNLELLVLVDGPPEAEQARLLELLGCHADDPRLHFDVQENAGTGTTRARLANRATGDYLVFIDDDDRLPLHALEEMAAAITANPGVEVVRGGTQLFGVANRYLSPRPRLRIDGVSADLFEVNQPFAVSRALVERLGGLHGDPGFGGIGEDSDLFMRLDAARANTLLVDKPLYERRLSQRNQSLRFGAQAFLEHIRTLVRRHCPPSWTLEHLHFQENGSFISQTAVYIDTATGKRLYCPSRYYNYNAPG